MNENKQPREKSLFEEKAFLKAQPASTHWLILSDVNIVFQPVSYRSFTSQRWQKFQFDMDVLLVSAVIHICFTDISFYIA